MRPGRQEYGIPIRAARERRLIGGIPLTRHKICARLTPHFLVTTLYSMYSSTTSIVNK